MYKCKNMPAKAGFLSNKLKKERHFVQQKKNESCANKGRKREKKSKNRN